MKTAKLVQPLVATGRRPPARKPRTRPVDVTQHERCLLLFWRTISEQSRQRIGALLFHAYECPDGADRGLHQTPEHQEAFKALNILPISYTVMARYQDHGVAKRTVTLDTSEVNLIEGVRRAIGDAVTECASRKLSGETDEPQTPPVVH